MKRYLYGIYISLGRRLFGKQRLIPFKIGNLFNKKYANFFYGTYLSYIPDRYSLNIEKYRKKNHHFFNESDIIEWEKGNYINNAGDLTRFYFLNLVIDQLLFENIIGDIAELGVYKGNSAFLLSKLAKVVNKKVYLFDTFQGFNSADVKGLDKDVNMKIFKDTSLEYVKKTVGEENAIFVQGLFPQSLEQLQQKDIQFSLVHIDCDLEQPFIHGLNFFYPRLVKGGFLILHDYSSLFWDGATNAIDKFFLDKPEMIIPIPDKSGTAVIRKL